MDPSLTTISDSILALLAPLKPDFEVAPWPDDPDEYTLTHPKGAILVVFQDWQFQTPEDTTGGTQPTGADFQVSTLNRSLQKGKENPGAYVMIEAVFDALQGQQIAHDFLRCRRIRLVSQGNGRFHYGLIWRLPNLQL